LKRLLKEGGSHVFTVVKKGEGTRTQRGMEKRAPFQKGGGVGCRDRKNRKNFGKGGGLGDRLNKKKGGKKREKKKETCKTRVDRVTGKKGSE